MSPFAIRRMPRLLTRYWFEWELTPEESKAWGCLLPFAVGVTAYHLDDAIYLIHNHLLEPSRRFERNRHPDKVLPAGFPKHTVRENVDPESLSDWVRGYGGCVCWRGIWYPPMNRYGPWPE
jgi:hypothetical protein